MAPGVKLVVQALRLFREFMRELLPTLGRSTTPTLMLVSTFLFLQ